MAETRGSKVLILFFFVALCLATASGSSECSWSMYDGSFADIVNLWLWNDPSSVMSNYTTMAYLLSFVPLQNQTLRIVSTTTSTQRFYSCQEVSAWSLAFTINSGSDSVDWTLRSDPRSFLIAMLKYHGLVGVQFGVAHVSINVFNGTQVVPNGEAETIVASTVKGSLLAEFQDVNDTVHSSSYFQIHNSTEIELYDLFGKQSGVVELELTTKQNDNVILASLNFTSVAPSTNVSLTTTSIVASFGLGKPRSGTAWIVVLSVIGAIVIGAIAVGVIVYKRRKQTFEKV
eukprot:TRINITY_DN15644_c0_g1_i1.p1 TRINITY_DN15644_c0_g1~~TRINITY_DN15644_c0_g1_i1.p1  ORF type:complete len:288 (+),score=36.75 TRINITY_DN15644_c0_g1_i1:121-984(+)